MKIIGSIGYCNKLSLLENQGCLTDGAVEHLLNANKGTSENMDAAVRNILSVVPLQNFRANGSLGGATTATLWPICMVSLCPLSFGVEPR